MLDKVNIEGFSFDFAKRVMALAATSSVEQFKENTVNLLADFLAFDSAQWVTRAHLHDKAGLPYLEGAFLSNIDAQKLVDYQSYINEDELLEKMSAPENWNRAFDLQQVWRDEDYFESDLYKNYAQKYGLERVLSVVCAREGVNFFQAITVYRGDREHVFSELERDFFERCSHWMTIALRHNILEKVGSSAAFGELRPRAVLDSDGFIFEIDAHLENWLNSQVLNYDGVYFPESLLDRFANEGGELVYPYYRLVKKTLGDLTLVYFNSTLPFDCLTDKEWKVAKLTIEGHSNKRTAVELGITSGTVQKHMQNIYTKLGIAELNDNHEKRRILSMLLSDYLRSQGQSGGVGAINLAHGVQ